jgi:tRNA-dihydrouridine synthase 2
MGCPRSFSISGGMGAALLTKPELIHDVCNAYPLKMLSFLFLFPFVKNFCSLYLTRHLAYFQSQILTTLRRNLETPVTCKIRLLKSSQDTVELARRIEKTGVSALAVHGR